MRDRLLIRHFLWRFLEHDLVSPNRDRRGVLSAAAGLLIATGLFTAVLVAVPYQFNPEMPPGIASVRSLDDRFFFISMSILVMALAAVGQWDALTLDARDSAVLSPLPIPHRVIVRSKLAATGLFALAVLVAWNICPTLLRPTGVPAYLGLGWLDMLRLTLAHATATCAAGLFGFLAVLGFRETSCALLGSARFQQVSTVLQTALVILLTTALLLLPGHSSQIGRRWLASEGEAVKLLPPLWFVAFHETLAGSVIDSVPNVRLPRYLVWQEEAATTLYRSLRPLFPALAGVALPALFTVTAIAIAACLWNSRRLPRVMSRSCARRGVASLTWEWLVTRVVVRTALQQAGFFFAMQSMSRRASHRITIAAAVAVALSLMIVASFSSASATNDLTSIPIALLATQSLAIGAVLIGFRHATRVPAELCGSMTFGIAWQGKASSFVGGVKRAGWLAIVFPTLAAVSMWHFSVLGPHLTLLHIAVGTTVGILTMDTLFFHNRHVPFVSAYSPSPDAKTTGVLYGGTILTASVAAAFVERTSFEVPQLYVGLLITLLGISAGLRRFDRVSPTATIELDVDDQNSLPTQRFSLNS